MTIAITVFGNRISSRLDCTENLILAFVDNGKVKRRENVRLFQSNPLDKIKALMELDVDVLICGGMPELCSYKLNQSQIRVYPWMRGDAEEILSQFLTGKLLTQVEP